MSNFKKGDLVEVIDSLSFPDLIGERFNLTTFTGVAYAEKLGEVRGGNFWSSPFKDFDGAIIGFRQDHLRKVNPDGDNLSEYTFEELMNNLKLPNKETQNV